MSHYNKRAERFERGPNKISNIGKYSHLNQTVNVRINQLIRHIKKL